MNPLDIVFNIDYPSDDSIGPLHSELPKYVEYVSVNDMAQFKRLISVLKENVECYIWVHPSLNSKRVAKGVKSDVETNAIPELDKLNIKYRKITRSSEKSDNRLIFDTNSMLEFKSQIQPYTVRQLHSIVFPITKLAQSSVLRNRIKDSLSHDIVNINSRLFEIRRYLLTCWQENDDTKWYVNLFPNANAIIGEAFATPYWDFRVHILKKYLGLSTIEKHLIDTEVTDVPDSITYNESKFNWQIDLSFFDEVSNRFEKIEKATYRDNLSVASCLYVIHEAVHKIHNLDTNTVRGIGNFPRIIEEADYQADTIAILIELGFFAHEYKSSNQVSPQVIGNRLCEIIKIAIETTFSFNRTEEHSDRIQVRRVNRYLIWFWHYFKIQALMKNVTTIQGFLEKVFYLLSVKPCIEITGPAIVSNEDFDRTFYDLSHIKHKELLGILLSNNEIVRLAPINDGEFEHLYSSMKESDFEKMLQFLNKLFGNYKILVDVDPLNTSSIRM